MLILSNPNPSFFSSMEFYKEYFVYNTDDETFTRFNPTPSVTVEAHNSRSDQTVFTKDFPLNTTHDTWSRLYKPVAPPRNGTKHPLILYFHYGGFIISSASDTDVHDICTSIAFELPAVVLSLEYRIAPEHRLPAAYEDAVEALTWIKNQALNGNENFGREADFSNLFLMGSSAGGNIAYHSGLRAVTMDLEPVVIRGYIFDHPGFSGEERSDSELRLVNYPGLPLSALDVVWELALPKGSNRDHEYCNPLVEGSYKDKIGMLRRCLFNSHGGDPLSDYGMKFAKMLEENGVAVVIRYNEEGGHLMDVLDLKDKGKQFFSDLQQFISSEN